ncbi:MAG: MOSC domain-containing protein [Leucobacter sp.]
MATAAVSALYRYPVKGFTPERRESLTVQPDGRIAGDRVLAFRFATAADPEQRDGLDYWPKAKGLSLQDFPALAELRLDYDDAEKRVRIALGTGVLVDETLDGAGRGAIVEAVTDYVLRSPEGARLRRPGRLPLVLVGDGETSRFQDRPRGYISVHGEGSVAELAAALGMPIDDRRFRSNVVVAGLAAWRELEWRGPVRIGEVGFSVEGPIVRCLATHANPDTGVRDAPVLTGLTRKIGQREPTLGRLMLPSGRGGILRVGDELEAE